VSARASFSRIFFLAVDAEDKDLIIRWAEEGTLPNFRALRHCSAWAPTVDPTGLFVGAIWPSHDPTHPRHDRELAHKLGDPLRDVHAAKCGRRVVTCSPS